ncbi:uncharacterized protein PHACADRAFT_248537 [Phanerochaete carnosa HHB-10118-sp]|uniref:F-box domain-containing protein n=1 Tax=Phanerochaete carnosa (strain HHB-10118-sp) TaxID=650164 RepID=K5WCP5_PHACS|nr:uncharacterized protein PHACADRAFT_248537 [Phanerochaete carnosa HHB-10118-sp]EKM61738.1 hypothetical protein PHACADRAFT_248537 [Phanerochaete carnosa HHB-10118-sp]
MDSMKDHDAGKVVAFMRDLSRSMEKFMRLLPRLIDGELFPRHWERLPTELRDHIYGLLPRSDRKTGFSALSLVSHTWCRRFRPRLFARLTLITEGDDRTLYGMVRSPLSAWLAEHIAVLHFDRIGPRGYPLWTALLRLLPVCHDVWHDFGGKPVRVSLSHSAGLKSSLRSITSLTLRYCNFPSFRILLRILADITYLEEVDLSGVTWSGDGLTTADAASNVCTGAFSHVRSVIMWNYTNNVAVAAWILAAASTRHSFTRRRTVGPAVPAETWAIIDLIQMFFKDDGELLTVGFDVKEATADTYRFVGSLPSAYISVRVVKSALAAGANEAWSVRQIVLADSDKRYLNLHQYFHSRDWSALASLPPAFPKLQQFQVLCGEMYSEEDFRALSDKVAEAMNNHTHPPATLQHDRDLPDVRYLQPALFDLTEADVEAGREEVRRRRVKEREEREEKRRLLVAHDSDSKSEMD